MVGPDVSVVISGQAIITGSGQSVQNGVVSVEIPTIGDSWSTTTDSSAGGNDGI